MKVFCPKLITAGMVIALCIGCNSGSSNDGKPTVSTGKFIDSAVGGIHYETATQEGTTNAAGEFSYVAGETVVFSIGDIALPSAPAAEVLSPCDLVGVDDTSNTSVVNIARLLQTLDSDGNPDNGITILEDAHQAASGLAIEFDSLTFDTDVADVVKNGGSVNDALIDASDATSHLDESLAWNSDDDLDTELPDLKFTSDWLNGRTLYNVYYDDDESGWVIDVFNFAESRFQKYDDDNVSRNIILDYSITPEGYLSFVFPKRPDETEYIKATVQTSDYLMVNWANDLSQLSNKYNTGHEYFYYDHEKARAKVLEDADPDENPEIAANNIVSGVVKFVDEDGVQTAIPEDAWIRLTPMRFQDPEYSWHAVNCKINSDGTFGASNCYTEFESSDLAAAFGDKDETFEVTVYKDQIQDERHTFNCGEDAYKSVNNCANGDWDTILVTPSDYQDRSDEPCSDN